MPIIFSNLNYICSNVLGLGNLQEQVRKAFCFKFLAFSLKFETFSLITRMFFSHSRSKQFWKQNTIYFLGTQKGIAELFSSSEKQWNWGLLHIQCSLCWLELELESKAAKVIILKWRIFSRTSSEQSGKNKKILIFPTGFEVHIEDMFWV